MAGNLDEFLELFQQQIYEEAKETYGVGVFDRWLSPKFFGKMPDATASARVTGSCGETMEIYLRIEGDIITKTSFYTDGCGASVACGSVAAELACNKAVEEAALVGSDTILEVLGQKLPQEHEHCALLAAETLQTAVHNHMIGQQKHKKDP